MLSVHHILYLIYILRNTISETLHSIVLVYSNLKTLYFYSFVCTSPIPMKLRHAKCKKKQKTIICKSFEHKYMISISICLN